MGGRRKKGLKEKIKEKLPGGHKDSQQNQAAATGGAYGQQEHAGMTGGAGAHAWNRWHRRPWRREEGSHGQDQGEASWPPLSYSLDMLQSKLRCAIWTFVE